MRAMKTAEITKLRMDMISQLTPWRGGDSGGEDPGIVFCSRIDRRSSARFNDESPVRFIGGGGPPLFIIIVWRHVTPFRMTILKIQRSLSQSLRQEE